MSEEELETFNAIKDNQIIKTYCELLHKMSVFEEENKPEKIIYKRVGNRDYIIVKPYIRIDYKDGKYYFRKTGYDGEIRKEKSTAYFCESLCNRSEEYIKKRLEKSIEEDNNALKGSNKE